MRQRDPQHEARLQELLALDPGECKRQMAVQDYRSPGYVPAEVLASLVRTRYGKVTGVLDAATAELHRRVVKRTRALVYGTPTWTELVATRGGEQAIKDAMQYFWEQLLQDKSSVCNAEVRFEVYLKNRVTDYLRKLLTAEHTKAVQIDDLAVEDEDGNRRNPIDDLEDRNGQSPEADVLEADMRHSLYQTLMTMPKSERDAWQFRDYGYDWATIARLLGCSVPTARAHYKRSLQKLQGVIE